MIKVVHISDDAKKLLRRVPLNVLKALRRWIVKVETDGLDEVKKIPGYHHEPLSGDRAGQWSFRLNRGWRGFYVHQEDAISIKVIEVNHHDY